MQLALQDVRDEVGDQLVLMADCCLDEYTDHGHCGVLTRDRRGRQRRHHRAVRPRAVAQADAGAHVVAPSGMMDGQVGPSVQALDQAGHADVAILAYSAKYASALYGPFRDAVDVQIAGGGDRKGYQQDWRNGREALVEVHRRSRPGRRHGDGQAGARLPRRHRRRCGPGRRARGGVPRQRRVRDGQGRSSQWLDRRAAVALEHLTAVKRAGADFILTYLARELAERNRSWHGHPVLRSRRLPGGRVRRSCEGRGAGVQRGAVRPLVPRDPRRCQLLGPGVQGGRRRPVLRAPGRRAPTCGTSKANRYIDLVQSYGAIILGHAHPARRRGGDAAAGDGTSYGAPTAREMKLAEAIAERVPRCARCGS